MSVTAERIVAAHQKIKAQRAAASKRAEEIDSMYVEKLERLEQKLRLILVQQGQKSFQTGGCTVYRHTEIIPQASDWETIYRWIGTNQAWDMLERRLKKTFITDYMEANKEELPPGVSVTKRFVAKVRRNPGSRSKELTDG
jgi:hypothetical protein